MDEGLKSDNYFLPGNGSIEQLHQSTSLGKKFIKKIHELVVTYYREKKDRIKKKAKQCVQGHQEHVRYNMKISIYSLIEKNDFNKSMKKLLESYQ